MLLIVVFSVGRCSNTNWQKKCQEKWVSEADRPRSDSKTRIFLQRSNLTGPTKVAQATGSLALGQLSRPKTTQKNLADLRSAVAAAAAAAAAAALGWPAHFADQGCDCDLRQWGRRQLVCPANYTVHAPSATAVFFSKAASRIFLHWELKRLHCKERPECSHLKQLKATVVHSRKEPEKPKFRELNELNLINVFRASSFLLIPMMLLSPFFSSLVSFQLNQWSGQLLGWGAFLKHFRW